jgi:hypothetical protein
VTCIALPVVRFASIDSRGSSFSTGLRTSLQSLGVPTEDMFHASARCDKGHVAALALVRPLPRVDASVGFEAARLRKTTRTHQALEGLFACVDSVVFLEVAGPREAPTAS